MVQWTRTYCCVPSQRFDGSTISYQFPGLVVIITGVIVATLRQPITKASPCKIQYDYYLVGTGGTYATFDLIPTIEKTCFTTSNYNGAVFIGFTDVTTLTPVGGAGGLTQPSTDNYRGGSTGNPPYLTSVVSGPDNSTFLGGAFPIVAQDSEISRWQGNIYQRVTKLVQAL